MVDFANSNLCGASPEFNKLASQFDSIKDILANNLETDAAALASLLDTSLTTLEVNLRGLIPEIPTVPKLNLQSEITSLISLPAGSPSFLSAFAEIELEFGDDIKAKGLELESLVTSATSAILDGGNCCALVPNLEKEAGSLLAAVQNAPGVKQAAENAITEASAVVNQNVDIEAKLVAVKEKIESFVVTSSPPTEDIGAFKVAAEDIAKTVSSIGGELIKVVLPGSGKNFSIGSGFSHKRYGNDLDNYDADIKIA